MVAEVAVDYLDELFSVAADFLGRLGAADWDMGLVIRHHHA